MSNKPEVAIISLLIECVEKMKVISRQTPEIQQHWVDVISDAVESAHAYVQLQTTEEALNDMGIVPVVETKSFV